MPRIANETSALLADLQDRLQRVIEAARQEGHDQALADVRSLVGGGGAPQAHRGPGRPRGSKNTPKVTKAGKPRKNPWAHMTADQKAERVKKMLAGRGLKPKSA